MHTFQPGSKPTAVLGDVPSLGVVAIPLHEARRRVELEAALSDAHTWGEAFAILTARQAAEITLLLYDAWMEDGGAVPNDDDPFDAETVLGLNDGTWIGWPPREAIDHDWFPPSITTIGTVHQTSHDGPYLSFDSVDLTGSRRPWKPRATRSLTTTRSLTPPVGATAARPSTTCSTAADLRRSPAPEPWPNRS